MAIVPNRDGRPVSGTGLMTDPRYSTPNRTTTATPVGVLTPAYVNELVQDTTAATFYRATGPANTDWVLVGTRSV